MKINHIYDTIRLQCQVFAESFAKDPPFRGNPGLNIFHATEIVPRFEGKTETTCLEITSEQFCLIAMLKGKVSDYIVDMYSKIRRLVEQAVGDKLIERNISTVIGKDKSCLYGEWSVARDGDVIQFTCKVSLTVPIHEIQTHSTASLPTQTR